MLSREIPATQLAIDLIPAPPDLAKLGPRDPGFLNCSLALHGSYAHRAITGITGSAFAVHTPDNPASRDRALARCALTARAPRLDGHAAG